MKEFQDDSKPIELLFPNAKLITGRTQFKRSASPHIRDRASFIPQLERLLMESGRLELKSDQDIIKLDDLEIRFMESHGHTPGMLLSQIQVKDLKILFLGDIAPGHPWINLPITMGYDRNPELLVDEKTKFFKTALQDKTWVFFTHDSEYAATKLLYDDEKKRFIPDKLVKDFNNNGTALFIEEFTIAGKKYTSRYLVQINKEHIILYREEEKEDKKKWYYFKIINKKRRGQP